MTERDTTPPAAETPRCAAVHPDTGLRCERVVPPHTGWPHVAGDGSQWDDETTRPDGES